MAPVNAATASIGPPGGRPPPPHPPQHPSSGRAPAGVEGIASSLPGEGPG
eukprot:CAMPEP_0174729154 /NCGR_PEP_ID=MMETSP1094-20130205/53148_1 /TAXON_ID=156173 /ORGANISM="Chrysochromulina brevifilum, Strain UTEX LB 985" /LENGTH=49 /DNA_ID= /DNA_START= /DNA_END= /DNA_ORIENTATION=